MTCKEILKEVQLVGIAKKKIKVAFYNLFSWTCYEHLNNTFRTFLLTSFEQNSNRSVHGSRRVISLQRTHETKDVFTTSVGLFSLSSHCKSNFSCDVDKSLIQ